MSEEQLKNMYERTNKLLNGENKDTYGFSPAEIQQLIRETQLLKSQLQQKENIKKEIREKLINSKEYKMAKEMNLTSKMSILIELLEILDKDITKKSDYNYEKVEKENKE